jgi:hypothetical protein
MDLVKKVIRMGSGPKYLRVRDGEPFFSFQIKLFSFFFARRTDLEITAIKQAL